MKPINVGLLGIGTVGGGTWDVLNRNADEIQRRAGRAIRIAVVADKETAKARKIVGKKAKVVDDALNVFFNFEGDPGQEHALQGSGYLNCSKIVETI